MLSKKCVYTLTLSERLALQHQWARSRRCLRCFHASTRRRAETESQGEFTPYKAPKRGPSRQQRATMISEEVKMIQRDHPSPSFGEPDPNTLRPPGARHTVDPEFVGKGVRPGRMGENDTRAQEGPLAQGVGREIRADEDVPDTSKMARGARSPEDTVDEPAEGGTSVLEAESSIAPEGQDNTAHQTFVPEHDGKEEGEEVVKPHDMLLRPANAIQQFRDELVNDQYSTSTIAGNRFESVVADQVQLATRKAGYITTSHSNKASDPKAIIEKIVAGDFDIDQYLPGKKFDQPALNQIARTTTMNGTYLPGDTSRFLQKVRSLLPAAQAGRAQQPREQQTTKSQ